MWALVALLVAAVLVYSVVPNLFTRWFGLGAVSRGPKEPAVALTFDDGPDPNYTPGLLDALSVAGVHATFFVIAQKAIRHPELLRRMLAEGHDVQLHGDRHLFVSVLPPATALRQVEGAAAGLRSAFHIDPRFYRPTWGLCNVVAFLPRVRRRYRLITWSIMVGDWRVTPPEVLLQRIVEHLRPGAVIVLHDSDETFGAEAGAPQNVVQLIPELVRELQRRGYQFRTIGQWF